LHTLLRFKDLKATADKALTSCWAVFRWGVGLKAGLCSVTSGAQDALSSRGIIRLTPPHAALDLHASQAATREVLTGPLTAAGRRSKAAFQGLAAGGEDTGALLRGCLLAALKTVGFLEALRGAALKLNAELLALAWFDRVERRVFCGRERNPISLR